MSYVMLYHETNSDDPGSAECGQYADQPAYTKVPGSMVGVMELEGVAVLAMTVVLMEM